MNYITGGEGFIGTALRRRIPGTIPICHHEISQFHPEPFDRLFFLSAYGNMHDQTEAEQIIQANVSDPIHLLSHSPKGFRSFVYVSTSSVKLPVRTLYASTKLAAERYLLQQEAPVCVIRPYSVTGVGEQQKHLIPSLIRSCMEGERLSLVLKPTHDYIDVEDVCAGIDLLSSEGATGVFELGSGIKTTNEEVLSIVEQVTGRNANVRIVNTALREYDSEDWVCRHRRAYEYGWKPTKTLKQSIAEMVAAYCEERE